MCRHSRAARATPSNHMKDSLETGPPPSGQLNAGVRRREGPARRPYRVCQKPEHPRASTSDDVECFFSMMRDTVGQNFTTKQVQTDGFHKVCLEFTKRLDPDLPFYYHTSTHTRFSEGPLPEFSQASMKRPQTSTRIPRQEQPAAFSIRRATLPVRGSLAVRAQFHNRSRPLELLPPPTDPITVHEHSYATLQ